MSSALFSCSVLARTASFLHARVGLVRITIAGLLWGTTGVVVRWVHDATGLSPVSIAFYRLAVAGVVLLLLSVRQLRALRTAWRAAPGTLVLVGVGLAAYQALYFVSVTLAGVSVATVISLGLAPIIAAGWEACRSGRLPGLGTGSTLVAGVVGLVLITMSSGTATATARHPILGLITATASGLGYVLTTLLSRHVSQGVAPHQLTVVSTWVGALTLAPLAVRDGLGFPVGPASLSLLVYLGAVTTALAYFLFYSGLRTTAGSTAAVLTLLEPLTAAVLAAALLAERLPLLAGIGGVLMLSAVAGLYLAAPQVGPTQPASSASSAGCNRRSRGR